MAWLAVLDGHLTGPVNVGNPGEFTMRELAELVVEITGSTSAIITMPLPDEREGDPLQRSPDITLVRDDLRLAADHRSRYGRERSPAPRA